MTMTEIARNAVEVAFSAAGDFVQSITWRKQSFGDYDATTGQRTVTNTDATLRAMEDKISTSEFARRKLSSRAVKLVVPAVDFENNSIEPTFEDKLIHRGTAYTVKDFEFSGTKAVWEVFADV